jgi:hypothetical protein
MGMGESHRTRAIRVPVTLLDKMRADGLGEDHPGEQLEAIYDRAKKAGLLDPPPDFIILSERLK